MPKMPISPITDKQLGKITVLIDLYYPSLKSYTKHKGKYYVLKSLTKGQAIKLIGLLVKDQYQPVVDYLAYCSNGMVKY